MTFRATDRSGSEWIIYRPAEVETLRAWLSDSTSHVRGREAEYALITELLAQSIVNLAPREIQQLALDDPQRGGASTSRYRLVALFTNARMLGAAETIIKDQLAESSAPARRAWLESQAEEILALLDPMSATATGPDLPGMGMAPPPSAPGLRVTPIPSVYSPKAPLTPAPLGPAGGESPPGSGSEPAFEEDPGIDPEPDPWEEPYVEEEPVPVGLSTGAKVVLGLGFAALAAGVGYGIYRATR